MSTAKHTTATVVPALRYRDARKAIDWLCTTFGFERRAVYPAEGGPVAHAELSFGNGLIMLGSAAHDSEYGRVTMLPAEGDGRVTQSIYLIVVDADAVYALAKAAGAPIVVDIKDEDYGGRGFTCRDLEGHVWSIGTYDPWATGK